MAKFAHQMVGDTMALVGDNCDMDEIMMNVGRTCDMSVGSHLCRPFDSFTSCVPDHLSVSKSDICG